MSWIILYRSLKTDAVHVVITDNALGLREFASLDQAIEYLESMNLPEGTPTQIVETDEL